MPGNKSSLRVYFIGRFNSNIIYQKYVFLQMLESITR